MTASSRAMQDEKQNHGFCGRFPSRTVSKIIATENHAAKGSGECIERWVTGTSVRCSPEPEPACECPEYLQYTRHQRVVLSTTEKVRKQLDLRCEPENDLVAILDPTVHHVWSCSSTGRKYFLNRLKLTFRRPLRLCKTSKTLRILRRVTKLQFSQDQLVIKL